MRRDVRGQPRGFTLLEVVVALALTSALVLMSLRWVATLGELSSLNGEQQDSARQAAYATGRLRADVESAGSCDPQRRDVALAFASGDEVRFYVDDNGDGHADLVTWRVEGGELRRGVSLGDPEAGVCAFSDVYTEGVVAGPVTVDGDVFTPVAAGRRQVAPDGLDCQAGGWQVCAWDALAVDLSVAATGDAPAPVEAVLDLRPDTHRG